MYEESCGGNVEIAAESCEESCGGNVEIAAESCEESCGGNVKLAAKLYTSIFNMYVCIHVCMCACMYVCVYLCMRGNVRSSIVCPTCVYILKSSLPECMYTTCVYVFM